MSSSAWISGRANSVAAARASRLEKRAASSPVEEEPLPDDDVEVAAENSGAAAAPAKKDSKSKLALRVDSMACKLFEACRRSRLDVDTVLQTQRVKNGAGRRVQVCVNAPPPTVTGTLHAHQLAGLNWLLAMWSLSLGAILADDMGLGKTIQVIAFLAQLNEFHAAERATGCTVIGAVGAATAENRKSAGLAAAASAQSSDLAPYSERGCGGGSRGTREITATAMLADLVLNKLCGGGGGSGGSGCGMAGAAGDGVGDDAAFALVDSFLDDRRAAAVSKSRAAPDDLIARMAAAEAASAAAAAPPLGGGGCGGTGPDDEESCDDDEEDEEEEDDDDDAGFEGSGSRSRSKRRGAAVAAPLLLQPLLPRGAAMIPIDSLGSAGPHLVVVPTSTAENWRREFAKWCPALPVLAFTGSQAERRALRPRVGAAAVVVTTYSLLERRDVAAALGGVAWAVLVLDEAHGVKNAASLRFAAVMGLRARFRLLLTGTPVQNNMKELTSLLRVIVPEVFLQAAGPPEARRYEGGAGDDYGETGDDEGGGSGGVEDQFADLLVVALQNEYDKHRRGGGKGGKKLAAAKGAAADSGSAAAAVECDSAGAEATAAPRSSTSDSSGGGGGSGGGGSSLDDLFSAFVLRRTKDAVLSELPSKTRLVRWVRMTPAQRAIADTVHSAVLGLDPARASLLGQATAEAVAAEAATLVAATATTTTAAAAAAAGIDAAAMDCSDAAAMDCSDGCDAATLDEGCADTGGGGAGGLADSAATAVATTAAVLVASDAACDSDLAEAGSDGDGGTLVFVGQLAYVLHTPAAAASSSSAPATAAADFMGNSSSDIGEEGAASASIAPSAATALVKGNLGRATMLLRKLANHPLLLRCRYSDELVLRAAAVMWKLGEAADNATQSAAAASGGGSAKKRKKDTGCDGGDGSSAVTEVGSSGGSGGGAAPAMHEIEYGGSLLPSRRLLLAASAAGGGAAAAAAATAPPEPALAMDDGGEGGSAIEPQRLEEAAGEEGAGGPDTALLACLAAAHRRPSEAELLRWAREQAPLPLLPPPHSGAASRTGSGGEAAAAGRLADFAASLLDGSDFDVHCALAEHAAAGGPRAAAAVGALLLPDAAFFDCGKVRALRALLGQLRARGSRALLFSQFTGVLDILERALDMLGHRHLRIDGSVAAARRQALVDAFADDEGVLVMLLSTRAGGQGINLTAADTVIIYDSDYNPLNDSQAEDRAYRIGQTRPVTVYRLLTAGTIEHHMADVSTSKFHVAQQLMSMSER